jgi:hypothetical protein
MTTMCTAGSEHIREADFREWLVKANPGGRIVYCTGELAKSLHFAFLNKDPNATALWHLTRRPAGRRGDATRAVRTAIIAAVVHVGHVAVGRHAAEA